MNYIAYFYQTDGKCMLGHTNEITQLTLAPMKMRKKKSARRGQKKEEIGWGESRIRSLTGVRAA